MHTTWRVLAGIGGALLVIAVLDAAIRTFVLPRGGVVRIKRIVSRAVRAVFNVVLRPISTYEGRDRVLAMYAPVSLLVLPASFLVGLLIGFAGLYYAFLSVPLHLALKESGSALFTLGFATPSTT